MKKKSKISSLDWPQVDTDTKKSWILFQMLKLHLVGGDIIGIFLHADIKISDQWALAVISRPSEPLFFVSACFAKTFSEHFF